MKDHYMANCRFRRRSTWIEIYTVCVTKASGSLVPINGHYDIVVIMTGTGIHYVQVGLIFQHFITLSFPTVL